ncbi:MAG: hypothetical protein KDK27_20120, partial [Leptospiraceae bacterium]|nr:hypothetical protein [Leptospiraceae bacterium]
MSQIYAFNSDGCTRDRSVWERCGRRGQRALELAEMKMPVVPGFILDARACAHLGSGDVRGLLS